MRLPFLFVWVRYILRHACVQRVLSLECKHTRVRIDIVLDFVENSLKTVNIESFYFTLSFTSLSYIKILRH